MVNEFMGASFHNCEYEYQTRNAQKRLNHMNDQKKQRVV